MSRYRIEYECRSAGDARLQSLSVPDIQTALIVADINLPRGSAELWEGERHIARIQKQAGPRSTYWRVC